jgi:hypothetical protein
MSLIEEVAAEALRAAEADFDAGNLMEEMVEAPVAEMVDPLAGTEPDTLVDTEPDTPVDTEPDSPKGREIPE